MVWFTGGAGFIAVIETSSPASNETAPTDVVVNEWLGRTTPSGANLAKHQGARHGDPGRPGQMVEGRQARCVIHLGAIPTPTATRLAIGEWRTMSGCRCGCWTVPRNQNALHLRLLVGSNIWGRHARVHRDWSCRRCARSSMNLYGWRHASVSIRDGRPTTSKKKSLPPRWAGLKFFNVYGPNGYHKGPEA